MSFLLTAPFVQDGAYLGLLSRRHPTRDCWVLPASPINVTGLSPQLQRNSQKLVIASKSSGNTPLYTTVRCATTAD